MLVSRTLRYLALGLVLSALSSLTVSAQLTVGHIPGTITDTSGAVIVGAQVTLTNNETGVGSHTVSTSTGSYTFEQVDPGTYALHVAAQGFSSAITTDVAVHVQQTAMQNFKLAVGNVTTQVTVSEATPTLQTQDASVGQEVNEHLVNNLPLVRARLNGESHSGKIQKLPSKGQKIPVSKKAVNGVASSSPRPACCS
jgi:protocatechuate 3,4-dioxygenase beta subunit